MLKVAGRKLQRVESERGVGGLLRCNLVNPKAAPIPIDHSQPPPPQFQFQFQFQFTWDGGGGAGGPGGAGAPWGGCDGRLGMVGETNSIKLGRRRQPAIMFFLGKSLEKFGSAARRW